MVNRSAQGRAFESLSAAILFAGCRTRGGRDGAWIDVRVGGSGGSFHALNCPAGEALYRVDARSGNAIDSLEGCCRRFPPQEVDPNAPVFDEAPAQGSTVTLSATTGGEIVLRAQGITAPVVMDLHAMSNCASRFALVAAISASRTGTAMSSRPPPPRDAARDDVDLASSARQRAHPRQPAQRGAGGPGDARCAGRRGAYDPAHVHGLSAIGARHRPARGVKAPRRASRSAGESPRTPKRRTPPG